MQHTAQYTLSGAHRCRKLCTSKGRGAAKRDLRLTLATAFAVASAATLGVVCPLHNAPSCCTMLFFVSSFTSWTDWLLAVEMVMAEAARRPRWQEQSERMSAGCAAGRGCAARANMPAGAMPPPAHEHCTPPTCTSHGPGLYLTRRTQGEVLLHRPEA